MSKDCFVNPATGLPLADEHCAIDVEGNPYGVDLLQDIFESSAFDSGSCFDDTFDTGSCFDDSSSSFDDWDSFSSMNSFDDGWL